MLTLIAVGFVAGLVTGLSPCVLPVLPGVLAVSSLTPEGTTPSPTDRRRPYLVIAGLLTSFTLLTLLGTALVAALGIPEGWLRTAGVVALIVVGIGLLVPAVGHRMEALFYRIPQRGPFRGGSAFLFGLTFGVAFVPCAGPVLAAITVLAATQGLSAGLLVLALAFSGGLAVPLLLVARLGAGMGRRLADRMPMVRRVAGAVLVGTGIAIAFGAADLAQRAIPGYVAAVQREVEDSDAARAALDSLKAPADGTAVGGVANPDPSGSLAFDQCARQAPTELNDCGPAPELTGITSWLNTTDDQSLTLAGLRAQGRVVLVDFWTYSCINCQRTLPYLTAWDAAYRDAGLTIVGVHSPEFAFERERANVAERAADFGVEYPIALDNDFATWTAFDQRYWPAKYLIDRAGRVRMVHYGEGAYAETEALIRQLLAEQGAGLPTGPAGPGEPAANAAQTPETYLGYDRARAYTHSITRDAPEVYTTDAPFGRGSEDRVTLRGTWIVRDERIEAGPDAGLILDFAAAKVFLVLGGEGTARVMEGDSTREVVVSGAPTLYELRSGPAGRSRIGVYVDEGMSAYAFTFG
jgi:cytochrome c biogenesis protein CcdA/thiol-disulfide isomerase/thioredoxin